MNAQWANPPKNTWDPAILPRRVALAEQKFPRRHAVLLTCCVLMVLQETRDQFIPSHGHGHPKQASVTLTPNHVSLYLPFYNFGLISTLRTCQVYKGVPLLLWCILFMTVSQNQAFPVELLWEGSSSVQKLVPPASNLWDSSSHAAQIVLNVVSRSARNVRSTRIIYQVGFAWSAQRIRKWTFLISNSFQTLFWANSFYEMDFRPNYGNNKSMTIGGRSLNYRGDSYSNIKRSWSISGKCWNDKRNTCDI